MTIVIMDERMAAAANAAMTTPTMAPVLRPDFVPWGNTGKRAMRLFSKKKREPWEQMSSLSCRHATIMEI